MAGKAIGLLQWKGGKFHLAEFIISRMPHHSKYREVFFGGGHVFWQKGLCAENVVNDLNSHLVNLYRVLADPNQSQLLKIRLRNTLYSKELFDEYHAIYWNKDKYAFYPPIERAYMYLYLNKVSFNGEFQHFAKRPDAGALYNIEGNLDAIHKKLRAGNTVIENSHFKDFIPAYDGKDVFFYLDPPYWVTTESQGSTYYEKVMKADEHEELYNILKKTKGKWLMSYDDVPIIRELYSEFEIMNTKEMHQSSASATGKTVFKSELLIANYDINTAGTLFDNVNKEEELF